MAKDGPLILCNQRAVFVAIGLAYAASSNCELYRSA